MVIRVVDACRLHDESDSEPPFAHQTSLILSDTRWLRIAGPTAERVPPRHDEVRKLLNRVALALSMGKHAPTRDEIFAQFEATRDGPV